MKKLVMLFMVSLLSYCAPVAAWTVVGKPPTQAYTLQDGTFVQGLSKGGAKRYYKIDEATVCNAEPTITDPVLNTYAPQFGKRYKYYTTLAGGQTYAEADFTADCAVAEPEPEPEPEPTPECVSYEFVGQQKIWVNPTTTNLNDCQYLLVDIKNFKGNGRYDVNVTMYDGAKVEPLTGARTCTPPL